LTKIKNSKIPKSPLFNGQLIIVLDVTCERPKKEGGKLENMLSRNFLLSNPQKEKKERSL
jgi:hypothetical protein